MAAVEESPGAEGYRFNSAFLRGASSRQINIAMLSGSAVPDPGLYNVDVYLNSESFRSANIEFRRGAPDELVRPCISVDLLKEMGLRAEAMDLSAAGESACPLVEKLVPGASLSFDAAALRLRLDVPRALMALEARGTVPVSAWQAGSNAGFISYSANAFSTSSRYGGSNDTAYVGFRSGLNLGLWRLRNLSSFASERGGRSHFDHAATYVQRALPALRSELTMGDAFLSGRLFDGVAYRGMSLASDERMLPQSQRGYAPVVRGIAHSNARVVIHQGDRQIYETTVAAGSFVIEDLYPNSYNGDLRVEVTESDGRAYSFIVPFSAVANSLRPGLSRYVATLGRTRLQQAGIDEVNFAEWTYERGLSNRLTLNGGLRAANGYRAALLGGVMATGAGAFGLDATFSNANLYRKTSSGWMVRGTYSRALSSLGTYISVAGYRYSTAGFSSLSQSLYERKRSVSAGHGSAPGWHQQNRFDLALSQSLGSGGQLYANSSYATYWGRGGGNAQYQLGYSNNVGRVSFAVSLMRQYNLQNRQDDVASLSFSIPLDMGNRRTSLGLSLVRAKPGADVVQANLAGQWDKAGRWSYSVNASRDMGRREQVFSGGIDYRSPYASVGAGMAWAGGSRQRSLTGSGGIVVHGGGVTFSPYLGDTFALVEAPGAKGAVLGNSSGSKINRFGYAVLPSLTPYAYNRVNLDPQGVDDNVELQQTMQTVVPYAGAILKLPFRTLQGQPLLISARQENGKPLPLGASVFGEDGREIGLVGQGSRIYARSAAEQARLRVKWGSAPEDSCSIDFDVRERKPQAFGMTHIQGDCVAPR